MNAKRAIIACINVAVFAGAGVLLYTLFSAAHSTMAPQPEAEDDRHGDAVVPVHVGVIAKGTVRRTLTAYGQIEPAPAAATQPAASASVGLPAAELVAEVACAEGDHVKAGQILFRLDTRTADAQVAQAQALVTASQSSLNDLRNAPAGSVPAWVVTAAQWETDSAQANLARARAEQQLCTIVAPISGTVTGLNVRAGQVADASMPALEIVDTNRLVAALDIPVFDAASVRPGQLVRVDISTSPANSAPSPSATSQPSAIEGSIVRVDPAADVSTGMVSADVALPADAGLRSGQFVRARIDIETHADCLVVPADAIVTETGLPPRIFLVQNRTRATYLTVELGIREGDLIEISAPGLTEGQPIVTGGAFGLPPFGSGIAPY